MAKTNTKPLSGMRDFLPLDVLRRNFVIDTIERVYQSYGFEPLETPTMERLDTLLGKYGDEGDQLIFRVMKRGDKLTKALADSPTEDSVGDAGLRYDLTVPLARVVAEYRNAIPRFFKRYQIQPVYRADRPAKGRYREFYQCDVDIAGSTSPTVEAEVLAAGAQVLQELGFKTAEDFQIRLNHRGILKGLMTVAGVAAGSGRHRPWSPSTSWTRSVWTGCGPNCWAGALTSRPRRPCSTMMADAPQGIDKTEEILAWLGDQLASTQAGSEGVAVLKQVVAYVRPRPRRGLCAD